jgi:hypothetical protein
MRGEGKVIRLTLLNSKCSTASCHFDERSEEKSPESREISPFGRDDTNNISLPSPRLCGEFLFAILFRRQFASGCDKP